MLILLRSCINPDQQIIQEEHKDDPKLPKFISESVSLNKQLLHQQDILCQKISQYNSFCQESDKITNHVVELRHDYDLTNEIVTNYMACKKTEEGRRAGAPIINDSHKELLFNNWDVQLREAEKAAEEAATATGNIIDCVNENFHKLNLISEIILGHLPQAQQLQTEWRQKVDEKAKSIQGLTRLNWDSYWTYLVKPHSQCSALNCIINSAEKIAPTLADSVFSGQLKSEVGQPPLLKTMLDACKIKDQIHK